MDHVVWLAFTGFLQGLALILSPCILPILPLMLSGSIDGSKKRPLGITAGFVITFALFTLFSRQLILATGIDANVIRYIAYTLLILLGIIMISTRLTEAFARSTQKLANIGHKVSASHADKNDFSSGLIFGALVALIWTPCAGPILATVILQTVLQQTSFSSFIVLLAFALGAGIPMLLISLFGRSLLNRVSYLKSHTETIRKALGVIIILSVIAIIYSEAFSNSVNLADETPTLATPTHLINGLSNPYPAPDFVGLSEWINSAPLTMAELKGKVVLIDFWTFSCINCKRTLPYLKSWYDKYHHLGLVIIGIHTPEFEFEKNLANVKTAVASDGILYPVALDNQFGTWQQFHNQYWPAHYLIDQKGQVVYTHFGEGDYDITEENIRFLLQIQDKQTTALPEPQNTNQNVSPETYFGYKRAARNANAESLQRDIAHHYTFPQTIELNQWALQGDWNVAAEHITSTTRNANLQFHFHAKDVYMVMGAPNHPAQVKFTLNGSPLIADAGTDVMNSQTMVGQSRMYHIVHLPESADGVIELTAVSSGLELYTFTFGGN